MYKWLITVMVNRNTEYSWIAPMRRFFPNWFGEWQWVLCFNASYLRASGQDFFFLWRKGVFEAQWSLYINLSMSGTRKVGCHAHPPSKFYLQFINRSQEGTNRWLFLWTLANCNKASSKEIIGLSASCPSEHNYIRTCLDCYNKNKVSQYVKWNCSHTPLIN